MFDNKRNVIAMNTNTIKNNNYVEGSKSNANATVTNNNLTFGNAVKKTQKASRFITCQVGSLEYNLLFEQDKQYILKDKNEKEFFQKSSHGKPLRGEIVDRYNEILIFQEEIGCIGMLEDCYKVYSKIEVDVLQVSVIAMNTLLVEIQEKNEKF